MKTWRETAAGYIFTGPMLLGVLIFTIIPLIAGMLLSLVDWNFVSGLNKMKFVGLNNFIRLFHDETFITSFKNNILLLFVVPVTMLFALLIAIVLNKKVFFKDAFKVIYFMPYISSVVAIAAVWRVLMHPTYGPINQFLQSIGIDNPPKWLADSNFALLSVMIIMMWIQIGYNLIIYIAALQNIPKDLYEAADIDGANVWEQFRNITVPMLSPTWNFRRS